MALSTFEQLWPVREVSVIEDYELRTAGMDQPLAFNLSFPRFCNACTFTVAYGANLDAVVCI